MLTEQTVDRLHHLRLAAMAEAYLAQQRDPAAASLSFDERLGMLVDAEQLAVRIGRCDVASRKRSSK